MKHHRKVAPNIRGGLLIEMVRFFWGEVQGIDLGDFWGLKSHDGHVIGDGHQPNSGGCRYACYKDFLKRWDDQAQYREFGPWHM